MASRAQTFGWTLLVTFLLGGVAAPVLHFPMHGGEDPRDAAPVDVVHWGEGEDDTRLDCALCDATVLGSAAVASLVDAGAADGHLSALAPERVALPIVGITRDRGPPLHLG